MKKTSKLSKSYIAVYNGKNEKTKHPSPGYSKFAQLTMVRKKNKIQAQSTVNFTAQFTMVRKKKKSKLMLH